MKLHHIFLTGPLAIGLLVVLGQAFVGSKDYTPIGENQSSHNESIEPVFKVVEPIDTEVETDSEYVPPSEMTEAELFQVKAQAKAGGWIASEAISLMDANNLYSTIRPAICDVAGSFTVADTQAVVEDQMRKKGHDEEAAEKIARGLVDATMEVGCP